MNYRRATKRREKDQASYSKLVSRYMQLTLDDIATHFIPNEEDVLLTVIERCEPVIDAAVCMDVWRGMLCAVNIHRL